MGNCLGVGMYNCLSAKTHDNNQILKPSIFSLDISNISRHSYAGQYKYCRISNIYDGDTADIYFYDEVNVMRFPFRFYGYDSAEIKPLRILSNRNEIKQQAQDDKQYLTSLVENNKLVVQLMENEKYGRLMGEVWRITDDTFPENNLVCHYELTDINNISKLMIQSGHGKPYYGGKKEVLE